MDRFCLLIQHLTRFCVQQLKQLKFLLESARAREAEEAKRKESEESWNLDPANDDDLWSVDELERLLQFMAKVFMLQFPLYAGPKQAGLRSDDVTTAEATQLAVFCDGHDAGSDLPVSLLRNVTLFCKSGGLQGMATAFTLPPTLLPPSMAHALISLLCNVKLWLNYRAVMQLFGPVRSTALKYMCEMSDSELRTQQARNIADFLWCSVKENAGPDQPIFDRDGLELAFKYFCSTTLTMRLTGIAQINSQIALFNEMCNSESIVEAENVGLQLATWIINKQVVEHLFGPNLHVEVCDTD